jgi:hypothetical protein
MRSRGDRSLFFDSLRRYKINRHRRLAMAWAAQAGSLGKAACAAENAGELNAHRRFRIAYYKAMSKSYRHHAITRAWEPAE